MGIDQMKLSGIEIDKMELTPCLISTLKLYVKNVNIEPGFHQAVFDGLKTKAEVIKEKSKLCAIVKWLPKNI